MKTKPTSDNSLSHSSLWLQKKERIGWLRVKQPYYVCPQDITPALHPNSRLSADAPIPQLGILEMLMAHWDLPFTVGSQRPMTS